MDTSEPVFSQTEAEKHATRFLNYTEEDLGSFTERENLRRTVLYWRAEAENLRAANVPLHLNKKDQKILNEEILDPLQINAADALEKFLDDLIPSDGISDELLAQKLRILISGGENFADFSKQMKDLDYSLKCNEIWENDSVAYRCNTCALTPCMSLCAECFLSNGHAGHDFTRFFSREGGACDCGNADVLHASGFCERHGPAAMSVQRSMPPVALAEYIYVKLIVRIFLCLREYENRLSSMTHPSVSVNITALLDTINDTVTFVQECVNMGGPMRIAMTRILTDTKLYQCLTGDTGQNYYDSNLKTDRILVNLDFRSQSYFERVQQSLIDERLISAFSEEMANPREFMRCETLLHEYLFWIVRLNFPQNSINFILSMLSDTEYLNMMALRFFKWYPLSANTMKSLCKGVMSNHSSLVSAEVGNVGSRIIHVSVQMLSSSALCLRMDRECNLVSTVFRSAYFLLGEKTTFSECFLDSGLTFVRSSRELSKEYRLASDCRVILAEDNAVIFHHGYWFVMGDIQNVMSHTQLAVETVMTPAFRTYLKIAYLMQGMNMSWRIVSGDHAPHDNGELAQRTFTMEYETLSITMFNFVQSILSDNNEDAAQHFFIHTLQALRQWIKSIVRADKDTDMLPLMDIRSCPVYSFTVHLPLHRHLSTAISHFAGMEKMQSLIYALREEEPLLRLILLHPLRIHVFRAEQHCNMWVRNGHQLRIQSMLYAQPHINASFFLPDLDLIRFSAANVRAEWFISAVCQSFHLDDFFEIEPYEDGCREDFSMLVGEDVPGRYSPDPSGTRQGFISQQKYNELSGKKQITMAETTLRKALEEEGIPIGEGPSGIEALQMIVDNARKLNETPDDEERLELSRMLTEVNKKLVANSDLRKLIIALSEVQKRQERIIKNDYSRISLEPGGVSIGVRWWKEGCILKRAEWVDSLVQNCFLLLAELLVIRTNCGATDKESMRMEMVHELATGKMKYSHIRQCITDKGSRSSINADFAETLIEVADYHEPDEGGNGHSLQQGGYTLKPELWYTEYCPVFAQMRATLPGRAQESLIRVEKHDLDKIPAAQRPTNLWIPYRLYEPGLLRHESVDNISKILFTDRFTQLALLTIESKRIGQAFLSENTLQLVVYLVSIAAHEAGSKGEPERVACYARFNRVYKVTMEGIEESYDISLFQSIYRLFMSHAIKKGNVLETLEKVASGSLYAERIVGAEIEYLGRLLAVMLTFDESYKYLVQCEIRSQRELLKKEEALNHEKEKEMERKMAMKRKREAIMEAQRQKGAKLMEKHRENEGLSQAEVNAMDISNRPIAKYECPICGDIDVPSTLQNPLGMMAHIVSNNVVDLQVRDDWEEPSILEALEGNVAFPQQRRFWDNLVEKDLSMLQLGIYTDIVQGPSLFAEIQTCGHTAHLECFKLFQQSQSDHHNDRTPTAVACPLCRTSVQAIIPMRIDADFGTSDIGAVGNDSEKSFHEIKNCILNWKKNYMDQVEETNFNDHYGLKTDNWMDRMSPVNQSMRAQYDGQTNLLALIRSSVERNIIYRKTGIHEKRKNGWALPIVQMIPAAVFRTTARNEEMCLSALRDLFVPEMVQVTRSISESCLPKVDSGAFDMEEAMLILAPSRQPDENQLTVPRKTGVPMPQNQKVESLLTSRADVPLLVFDFRLLFVRIACYIVDNDNLSNGDKLALLQSLARQTIRATGIRSAVILLHRVTPILNNQLIQDGPDLGHGNMTVWLLKYACDWFRDSPHMWKAVQSSLSEDEFSISEYSTVLDLLQKNVENMNEFCTEFIYSTGLVSSHSEVAISNDLADFEPLVKHWIRFFVMTLNTSRGPNENILHRTPLSWKPVGLLTPPKLYDELFSKIFKKKCPCCDKVPVNPFICMHCGQMVCFGECCKTYDPKERTFTMEVNKHADACTGNTAVFLALNSAVIVIMKGKVGCIWGSIYLDAHGEEDRNLRRGKQLFLSESRLRILQNDFISQCYDRISVWYYPAMLFNLVVERNA